MNTRVAHVLLPIAVMVLSFVAVFALTQVFATDKRQETPYVEIAIADDDQPLIPGVLWVQSDPVDSSRRICLSRQFADKWQPVDQGGWTRNDNSDCVLSAERSAGPTTFRFVPR